jgi:crotonobetainyl-CoA:carnitine CoA-transferase CaiB-like acyl-CoA transferase
VGEEIHTSLYGSAVWLMYANLVTTSALGTEIDTSWNRRGHAVLRSTFRCRDGEWLAGTHHPEDPYWPRFCTTIGREDLVDDERYATKDARMTRLPEVYDILDHEFAQRDRDEWLKIFRESKLLFAPVQRFTDVLTDAQARANGYIVDIDHRRLGALPVPGYPISFGGHRTNRHGHAPTIGEHSDEVLAATGLTPERIAALRERGVVG